MPQYRLGDKQPAVDASAFVAPDASLVAQLQRVG